MPSPDSLITTNDDGRCMADMKLSSEGMKAPQALPIVLTLGDPLAKS